jgi:outer membrane protein assembly factor BamB
MIELRPILAVLALGAAALFLFGCSGDRSSAQGETSAPAVAPRQPGPPPATPAPSVRVVDGDTSKPVKGAHVVVARAELTTRLETGRDGVVELPPAGRATVLISAPRYHARRVRLDFRKGLDQDVSLWRPALQWPIYGANPARTQVHAAIKIHPPFRVVWRRDLGGLLEFPPVVWEGVAYVNNMRGVLRALSMRNGRILWRKRVGGLMASSPTIDPTRGVLVVTTMSPGDVKAVSMKTGRVRWRYSTGRTEPSPVIRKGIAYFGAANGNVYALDLDRHRPRWIFRGGAKITSSPALVGSRLYFGDYAGRVFALNARNGRVLWRGSAGSRVYGTVAVAGGRVFAPSVFSGLSALSARSGRLLWRIPVGVYLYSSPAAFRKRVYFGTYAGLVYCAAAGSGRILWTRQAGGSVSGAVQIVSGVVYAGSFGNRITAWNWRTGRTLWTFPHGRYVPVSGNGARLLINGGRGLWAVESKRR